MHISKRRKISLKTCLSIRKAGHKVGCISTTNRARAVGLKWKRKCKYWTCWTCALWDYMHNWNIYCLFVSQKKQLHVVRGPNCSTLERLVKASETDPCSCMGDTTNWTCTYFEPLVDALGMKFVAAGQNSQGLPNFKVTHANHASSLVIFRAVTGVSAMKRYYVVMVYL